MLLSSYNPFRFIVSWISVLLLIMASSGCNVHPEKQVDVSMYQYRDTKDIVKFTYEAALRLERDGMKGVEYLRKHRANFNKANYYLYVFSMDGTNLFHAGMKELEGKNLSDMRDKNGKPIMHLILTALEDKANPHAWVHYSWWEPGKFYPVPKSSCHFKVRTPEGKALFVGAGMSYPHEEQGKRFINPILFLFF